jgi:hypothetical protein
MRVTDCPYCAETLTAPNDDQLVRVICAHLKDDHQEEVDPNEAKDRLLADAYDAMDS